MIGSRSDCVDSALYSVERVLCSDDACPRSPLLRLNLEGDDLDQVEDIGQLTELLMVSDDVTR